MISSALAALVAPRTWRATRHVLAGGVLAAVAGAVLGALVIGWGAAAYSLYDGATGAWYLPVAYVAAVLVGPFALAWCAGRFGQAQRLRFRHALGVELRPPRPRTGVTGWRRPLQPLLRSATWRQLAYHLLAVVAGTAAALAVAGCWSAVVVLPWWALTDDRPGLARAGVPLGLAALVAAPWLARGLARADEVAARALLGPGRHAELSQRIDDLSRSRAEVIAATDAERRRIERDLHDGAQQRLVSLALNLGMARAALGDAPEPARRAIEQAHDEATLALAELREFVRGLHPAVMNDRGLDAALSGIAARAPVPVRLTVSVEPRCPADIEAIAYFTVSEALTNVARHAGAHRAEVSVERRGDVLRIVVTDDGHGGADEAGGTGLRGLAQRAQAVDGTMTVHSPPGGPTTITVELPCAS